jgi:hypothetical protein
VLLDIEIVSFPAEVSHQIPGMRRSCAGWAQKRSGALSLYELRIMSTPGRSLRSASF